MSRLVTSSPTSGSTIVVAALAQQPATVPHTTNSSSYLVRAKAVENHGDSFGLGVRAVGEHAVDQGAGQIGGGRHRLIGDAGLAVDPQPHAHLPLGDGEQGIVGAGHGAPVESDAEGAGRGIGRLGDPDHPGEIQAVLGGGARALENGEIACDTATLFASSPFGALAMSSVTAK